MRWSYPPIPFRWHNYGFSKLRIDFHCDVSQYCQSVFFCGFGRRTHANPLLDLLSLKIINNPIEGLVHDLVTLQERRQVDILQTCQKELVNGIIPLVIQRAQFIRSEEHTSELQSLRHLVC